MYAANKKCKNYFRNISLRDEQADTVPDTKRLNNRMWYQLWLLSHKFNGKLLLKAMLLENIRREIVRIVDLILQIVLQGVADMLLAERFLRIHLQLIWPMLLWNIFIRDSLCPWGTFRMMKKTLSRRTVKRLKLLRWISLYFFYQVYILILDKNLL